MTWLVAGLGNPGEPYTKTRHNLGYRVVDELAAREGEREGAQQQLLHDPSSSPLSGDPPREEILPPGRRFSYASKRLRV